jgi:uncharacterized membrane protein YeiH
VHHAFSRGRFAAADLRAPTRARARVRATLPPRGIVVTLHLLVLLLDLAGTFVFALSGATAAVRRRLDLFGVLVLAFVAANSGGILRDVLIGAVPPASISDWRYLGASVLAGLVTFRWAPAIERLKNPVRLFDAAGLAMFAVVGANKALEHGLEPPMAALLGMLSGIGGGIVRDVLLREVPLVLRAELYAVAALAGALVVVTGEWLAWPTSATMGAGALLCFALRMAAIRRGWRLPVARAGEDADGASRIGGGHGNHPPRTRNDSDA